MHFLKLLNTMGLLCLLQKSNCSKTRSDSLVLILLKEKYDPLIEPLNLLINFLMLLQKKLSFKDSLVLSIILLIFTKICESIANLCLTDCGAIHLLRLMNILLLLNRSKFMSRLFLVVLFLLIMFSKLLKLMLLKLDLEVF
jgi:hypothetical protein